MFKMKLEILLSLGSVKVFMLQKVLMQMQRQEQALLAEADTDWSRQKRIETSLM